MMIVMDALHSTTESHSRGCLERYSLRSPFSIIKQKKQQRWIEPESLSLPTANMIFVKYPHQQLPNVDS